MITGLYAAILALLYINISWEAIKARRKHGISLGAGPNNEIEGIIGAHSNFSAYVPISLILLFFCEPVLQRYYLVTHLLGVTIVVGRYFHFIAMKGAKMNFKFRRIGMYLTFFPLLLMALINIIGFSLKSF